MGEKTTEEEFKFKELVELNTNAGEEYQEAMLHRVEYFAKKNAKNSVFNNIVQNTLIKGLGTILDLKVKVDKALGEENMKKIHDVMDQILLFGL